MKRLSFIFLFIFTCTLGFCQSRQTIVNLKKHLAITKPDTSRIRVLLQLGEAFGLPSPLRNVDSAMYYINQVRVLSSKNNYRTGEAEALLLLGNINYANSNVVTAISNYQKSLKIYEELNDTLGIIKSLRGFSTIYFVKKDFRKELDNYLKIEQLARKINNKQELISTLNRIGVTYFRAGFRQLDSATYYIDQSLQLNPENDRKRADALAAKGFIYSFEKSYPKALDYLRQALTLYKKFNDERNIMEKTFGIGDVYFRLNQLDSALHYSQLAYQLGSVRDDSLHRKKLFGFRIATIYDKLNNHRKAATYYRIAINAIEAAEKQGDIQRLLDLEYQDKERKWELEKTKSEYTNNLRLYASLGGLFFVSMISFFLYRNNRQKQKANALLQHQRDEIYQQRTQLQESLETLRSTQAQLIQKEKLASLGELTAGIAHEIQNPLNFVNNFSELSVGIAQDLKEEINRPALDKEYIEELLTDLGQNQEKINHHGKRASSIVKGMLEHSRTRTGEKELTDINNLSDEYLRLSYHGMKAKDKDFQSNFRTEFDEDLPKIAVIPQEIGRVLLNLFNNAFYAVNQRNLNTVETLYATSQQGQYKPTVIVFTKKLDNFIEIRVKDNGTGMPEAIKAKIFQPFFTTKPTGEGTGLGLSLSYDIITKGHGGMLEVESIEGEGTTFIIKLPYI
ncbi:MULTISPECIES: ATP-binding protein [Emticicia]|uniref:tetratricopeptide repeat-containing sensor histidine kinase n=1 Tax=Emticicia TaxID=312278 RepID=UPI0007D8BC0A|nr:MULTISPECIES: ATP-binding protein [Emticicia]